MQFTGLWHIQQMEMWDESYFNMEVQAFIKIEPNLLGSFQFGLVSGQLDGEVSEDTFHFNWEGNDECDPASGSGRCKLTDAGELEGNISLFLGDSSSFTATRA
ncbi:MAG: hypothetical protein AAFY11_04715 [Cyanobacteria bacterium J06641_5]